MCFTGACEYEGLKSGTCDGKQPCMLVRMEEENSKLRERMRKFNEWEKTRPPSALREMHGRHA